MGIGNGIEITHAVKGVGALPCGNSADLIIGNVRSHYWLKKQLVRARADQLNVHNLCDTRSACARSLGCPGTATLG